jgi:ATP-binding cassette subfamily B protein
LIDGQDIADLQIASLYYDIGYLTQDSAIFDGSVRENLMYGD